MFASVCADVFGRFLLGWIHVWHMFVCSPVLCAKHSQSFLFHLNQSAYEFFFGLHEVGSIYVGMFVHRMCWYECAEVCVCVCVSAECGVEGVSLEQRLSLNISLRVQNGLSAPDDAVGRGEFLTQHEGLAIATFRRGTIAAY